MSPEETTPQSPEATEANYDQPSAAETPQQPEAVEDDDGETDDDTQEAPPSTLHPAAPAGTTEEDEALARGREEYGEYFIGMWGEHPNFGCPYCPYADITGNGFIELHVLGAIEAGDLKHMAALQLKGV